MKRSPPAILERPEKARLLASVVASRTDPRVERHWLVGTMMMFLVRESKDRVRDRHDDQRDDEPDRLNSAPQILESL